MFSLTMGNEPLDYKPSSDFSCSDPLLPDAKMVLSWTKEEWEAFYQSEQYAEAMKRSWKSKSKGDRFEM